MFTVNAVQFHCIPYFLIPLIRKHFNDLLDALIGPIRINLKDLLSRKNKATSFLPTFGVTCAPGRETNHAIMLVICVDELDGVRKAIPIGTPKIYSSEEKEILGGRASALAKLVINVVLDFTCMHKTLSNRFMGTMFYHFIL